MSCQRAGFTLVELLAVIAIIAILGYLMLLGASKAIDASKRGACMAQLQDLGRAVIMYSQDHPDYQPSVDWHRHMSRYLKEERVLLCPADAGADPYRSLYRSSGSGNVTYTSFGMNYHAFSSNTPTRTALLCDASKPIFGLMQGDWHYRTVVNELIDVRHPGGVNCVFRDGHAELLTQGLVPWLLAPDRD